MKKTPSLFQRAYEGDRRARDELVPGSEWVAAGEGLAHRKLDGTCCLVQDGVFYKRFNAGKGRAAPPDFVPAQPEPDPVTTHWPGWVPVRRGDPGSKYHVQAWDRQGVPLPDGTYELIGPKVQGGAEADVHRGFPTLVAHTDLPVPDAPRDFAGLRDFLEARPGWEGLVWHHPDGRKVKVKLRDFTGLGRGNSA